MARGKGGGPLGDFRGKVSKVVIYDLNGQRVMRSIGKRTTPYSVKELEQHNAYALLNQFLRSIKDFYKIGFDLEKMGTTSNAYNLAIKYNYDAIISDSDGPHIDYSKVLVTKGKLKAVEQATVKINGEGLELNWNPQYDFKSYHNDDQVMILLCCEKDPMVTYQVGPMASTFLKTGALREAGTMIMPLNNFYRMYILHVYISFVSNDRKKISDSQYLGKVNFNV